MWTSRVLALIRRWRPRAGAWWLEQSLVTRQCCVRGVVGLGALTVVAGALWLTRDPSHEFDSLPDAHESLRSVGVDCKLPARTDVANGRDRSFCTASDGSLVVLQLSNSSSDAQAAVGDAHADSEAVLRYAQLAKQTPVVPRPVLLGDNWTLVGNTVVLERVSSEYSGTIYPYPETPTAG